MEEIKKESMIITLGLEYTVALVLGPYHKFVSYSGFERCVLASYMAEESVSYQTHKNYELNNPPSTFRHIPNVYIY